MALFRKKRGTTETMKKGAKLITVADPQSPVSEQFRTVRTNINFMAVDHDIKTLAFTSANVSEGKSTVTANVAITYAQSGVKTLLIDGDLRRPTLHSTFNVRNNRGLTTVLTSESKEINLEDIIEESGIENLSILTSGPIPPNPAELIGSHRMRTFIDLVKTHYDLVIIDLAPVLEVSDTQELASHLDGVVLVVRQAKTQKPAIKRAVDMLKFAKVRILGYVMNDISSENAGYGYGYGYGETSNKKSLLSRFKK
ncbi:CpsD/CapB family tyrosine-protein kinase [Lactobacillus xujianguonis]|uniref:CpsD/CapB family tyrosine-protein kinase n=1 Tax=Lactobacillus xujianguonis TaxID=2495899 RepID=UPI000FDA1219|nr:CpsD/CapB family tyrosine-protein kinase [Lactobacillus xujianguonis]RVU73565.1 polysaccharide biosynthesis tyrosine autokinase [Lactobacillus xujianguonis]